MTAYEDEIDLRPYILAVLQRWWFILLAALILASAAFYYGRTRPQVYESTATILLARSRATLNLAEQFPTVNEPIDPNSRMNALISIAGSDELALKVIQALGDKIPSGYRDVNVIKGLVELRSNGDIILVVAKASDPQKAADIANVWAQQAVDAINTAYSGEQPLAEIQNQLKSTRQEYETAQSNLESFIQGNKINLLDKQIAETQTLFNQVSGDRSSKIAYYSERKQRMEDLRVQSEALKFQLQNGSRSQAGVLGDSLAVLLARARALGINLNETSPVMNSPSATTPGLDQDTAPAAQPPVQVPQGDVALNVQIGELQSITGDPASQVADLDSLIKLSDQEISRSEEALKSFEQDVLGGSGNETLQAAAEKLGVLQTQLEVEKARQRELTSQRDLTWNAYQAMAQKETELRNATQTNNQVILASMAIPPKDPLANAVFRNALVAGILGLILGTAIVLAVHWWRSIDLNAQPVKPTAPEY